VRFPERTCVGCRAVVPLDPDGRRAMVRVVVDGPRLRVDPRGRLPGRGAWVHRRVSCLASAIARGGFARSLRRKVEAVSPEALRERAGAAGVSFSED
jgi:predicted RNA-binding protein YlxR (DUF448 family)